MNLEDKFRQAAASRGGYLRVTADHPVELFAGVDEGRRSLLLISEHRPADPPLVDSMQVSVREREDGRWAMTIQLKREELAGLFSYLASDLATASLQAESNDRAASILIDRLKWWQRLLSRGRSGVLSDNALRGLVAELIFLADCVIAKKGPDIAVASWVGPFEAPKDFRFETHDVEIKSIWRDSTSVRIASVEQLADSGAPLRLGVVVLEQSTASREGAFNCAALLDRVRRLCEPSESAIAALAERLWAVGYADIQEYEDIWFTSRSFSYFDCRSDFPRIEPAAVPAAVVACKYEIALSALEPFRTTNWSLDP